MQKKIKVMSVFGTRPEASKMCPLVRVLSDAPDMESLVCVTAQHRDMLDSVLETFRVRPDFDLNIMKKGQTLTGITCAVLEGLEQVFESVRPDLVLVHGDTTTSFAGALAAFYKKIPVAHVEAGLRTYDRYSPFPEEMNRNLTGRLASYHFSPTENNRRNLLREGVTAPIFITGNTGLDAFRYTIQENYSFRSPSLKQLLPAKEKIIVLTAHRRENQAGGIANICRAVRRLTERHSDIRVIYPVHLSPAVRNIVFPLLEGQDRIHLTDPLDLEDMHNLLAAAYFVMTDSGGLQEEAPALGIPVLVLRTETERPEAAEAGTVRVIGTDERSVLDEAERLLTDFAAYRQMASAVNPYGDGRASEKILEAIRSFASDLI